MADDPHSGDGTPTADAPPVSFSFKKKRRRGNARSRTRNVGEIGANEGSAVLGKKAKTLKGLKHQTTKRNKMDLLKHSASRSSAPSGSSDQGATSTLEVHSEWVSDSRGGRDEKHSPAVDAPSGTYKGLAGYKEYLQGGGSAATSIIGVRGNRAGPVRPQVNVRISSRFDYQPDICKDYKETGYCGYGDTCKFVHDRGDYKSGWELEKEWEEKQKLKEAGMLLEEDDLEVSEEDDEYPCACFICRGEIKTPVITNCKHFFCESCALKRFKTTSKCAVCDRETNGVFNYPTKSVCVKLKERRAAWLAEQSSSEGDDGSSEDSNYKRLTRLDD